MHGCSLLFHDRVSCVGLVIYMIATQHPKRPARVQSRLVLTYHWISLCLRSLRGLLCHQSTIFRKHIWNCRDRHNLYSIDSKSLIKFKLKQAAGTNVSKCTSHIWPSTALSAHQTPVLNHRLYNNHYRLNSRLLRL
jgi:hypothetical protein